MAVVFRPSTESWIFQQPARPLPSRRRTACVRLRATFQGEPGVLRRRFLLTAVLSAAGAAAAGLGGTAAPLLVRTAPHPLPRPLGADPAPHDAATGLPMSRAKGPDATLRQ